MMKSGFFQESARKPDYRAITKAFLITGGTENIRKQKISDLIKEEQYSMIVTFKGVNEVVLIFFDKHGATDGMTFEKAKSFAGKATLGANFHTSTFGREQRFGIIDVSSLSEEPSADYLTNVEMMANEFGF